VQLILATVPAHKHLPAPSIVTDDNLQLLFDIQDKVPCRQLLPIFCCSCSVSMLSLFAYKAQAFNTLILFFWKLQIQCPIYGQAKFLKEFLGVQSFICI